MVHRFTVAQVPYLFTDWCSPQHSSSFLSVPQKCQVPHVIPIPFVLTLCQGNSHLNIQVATFRPSLYTLSKVAKSPDPIIPSHLHTYSFYSIYHYSISVH